MRKILTIFLSCLFIFSCTDDFYGGEENLIDYGNSITFQDKVIDNGIPVEGAIVSIYGNDQRYFDSTNSKGEYSIVVPAASLIKTGFMSLNVFHPEYKPLNISYKAPLESNTVYDSKSRSSQIAKCEDCMEVRNKNYSELYHLGDNNFGGAINSQFQKASDGVEVSFNFQNSTSRSKVKITFEAKGLQPSRFNVPAAIIFGDQTIDLDMSPNDGSYQKYAIEFENNADIETITFKTSEPRSDVDVDVDDWEFTSFFIEGLN